MKIINLFCYFILLAVLSQCGLGNTETERQEVIDRLRALGVNASPTVSQIPLSTDAATFVTLNVIAALPGDDAVTVTPWLNLNRLGADVRLAESEMTVESTSEQKVGPLRILTIKAKAVVPNEKRWKGSSESGGTVQYGFKLTTSNRTEYISGEFLAYKKGEKELAIQGPSVSITDPVIGASLEKNSENEIYMSIKKTQEELVLPGWFVSEGVVGSRRMDTTTWKPAESGEHVLIATIRGRESLGFSYEVVKVTVP